MGSGRPRWKLSFHRSSSWSSASASPSPSHTNSAATPETPPEFLCPISRTLMADPVIVPSGHTFERACIEACVSLNFSPPSLSPPLDLSFSPILIPNVALRTAIVNWCDRSVVPRAVPLSSDGACEIVRRLMPPDPLMDVKETDPGTTRPLSVRTRKEKLISNSSSSLSSGLSMSSNSRFSSLSSLSSSSSSCLSSSPSYPSCETPKKESPKLHETPESIEESNTNDCSKGDLSTVDTDCLEEEIMVKLKDSDPEELETTMVSFRQATRESRDRRLALCTPRLLAALRLMLLSRYAGVQTNATAAIVNLSVEKENKLPIVRSGAVPPLVGLLKGGGGGGGHTEVQEHAAGAIFSLALEEENRPAIGVLGAIPPLIQLFTRQSDGGNRLRRDAGMALYHLSLAAANRTKVARTPGAVKAMLAVAAVPESPAMMKLGMMVVSNLAGCTEGRAALMDGGAVKSMVEIMRNGCAVAEEEQCLATLYGMSKGSLRFRGLAKAVGAENVLVRVAEEGEGVRRDMAKKILRALEGDEREESIKSMELGMDWYDEDGDDGSIVLEGLMSFKRRNREFGSDSGSNSTEF